jgi:G3E family GTPase
MTKINIFSGFLGAGKTTLIKKLISEGFNDKCVLIENEFGEISVDGGFMKEAGVEIREINSGCICCSLVGDFETSLRQVMEEYKPERIIIEPSGVGKLSDVRQAVARVCTGDVEIDGSIAVVNAKKCKMYARNYGEFFKDQIIYADCIVLSRTQELSEEKLADVVEFVRDLNEKAPIVTTPWDNITGGQILAALHKSELLNIDEVRSEHEHHHHHDHDEEHEHHHHEHDEEHEHHHHHDHDEECEHHHHHEHDEECEHHHHEHGEECGCGHDHHDHHHHHADEVFTSWGKETAKKYTPEQLEKILHELDNEAEYGIVLRAKGIVPSEGGEWLHFNFVPGECVLEKGAADYTGRFCVIGSKLNEEKLTKLFLLA